MTIKCPHDLYKSTPTRGFFHTSIVTGSMGHFFGMGVGYLGVLEINPKYYTNTARKIKFLLQWFLLDGWDRLVFVVVYMLQPLVFSPTFLMTICEGLLYGPLWGLLYSYVGANAAASVCYGVGRLFA